MNPTPLIRSLDQEVLAVLRGASLECLVCGEFVQHLAGAIRCPECGADYGNLAETQLQFSMQAG